MQTILQAAAEGRARIVPWTLEQYHRALVAGFLPEDASVELLDGFIVCKNRAKAGEDPMTIGDRHRVAVVRLAQLARQFESSGCFVQTQQPVSLPPSSEPEPDAAIVRGTIDDYLDAPPGPEHVPCVVEVADGSLSIDLGPKLRAYARAQIPQYVVVDLVNDRVIVHEEPTGDTYSRVATLTHGDAVAIVAGSDRISVAAARLLPVKDE